MKEWSYRAEVADVWLCIFVYLFESAFRCVCWPLCGVCLLLRHSWKQIRQNIPSLHSPIEMVFGSLHFLLIPVLMRFLTISHYFWPLLPTIESILQLFNSYFNDIIIKTVFMTKVLIKWTQNKTKQKHKNKFN